MGKQGCPMCGLHADAAHRTSARNSVHLKTISEILYDSCRPHRLQVRVTASTSGVDCLKSFLATPGMWVDVVEVCHETALCSVLPAGRVWSEQQNLVPATLPAWHRVPAQESASDERIICHLKELNSSSRQRLKVAAVGTKRTFLWHIPCYGTALP